jgi:hypothetical protein
MTELAAQCLATCGTCGERCDVRGAHGDHGHDLETARATWDHDTKGILRMTWINQAPSETEGSPCQVTGCTRESWILFKLADGTRRPTCSICFTRHATKQTATVA